MAETSITVTPYPFLVQASELVFYYPKIVKAVGHDRDLFPFRKIEGTTKAKLVTGDLDEADRRAFAQWQSPKNVNFQRQLEEAAQRLLNPKGGSAIRTPQDAQRVLAGFIRWLYSTKTNYRYMSDGSATDVFANAGVTPAKLEKLSHNVNTSMTSVKNIGRSAGVLDGHKYNVFASVKSPMGNCQHVAQAFALLLFLNGFSRSDLYLCQIEGQGGQVNGAGIFFKGEGNNDLDYVLESPKGTLAPACELSGGASAKAVCKQLYPKDADRPFDNHWVVRSGGVYYDPLYRCSYKHPDLAFDRIQRVRGDEFRAAACFSPVARIGAWDLYGSWDLPARKIQIFTFESKKIQQLLGVHQGTKYILHRSEPDERDVVVCETPQRVTLPEGVGRWLGYCLPDDELTLNIRLMRAVMAYEKGCTGIFRNASPESVQFCKKARVFCGETETAPDNRGKIYRPTDGVDWKTGGAWSQQEARGALNNAIFTYSNPPLVGTTLRKCLWEAFHVPSVFRS